MSKRALSTVCTIAAIVGLLLLFVATMTTTSQTTAKAVAHALSAKYAKPVSTFSVDVATDTGQFARGTVHFTDEPGGGVWFAAKTTAGWQLAYDGNGIVPCNTADTYNFPNSVVPECIDTENNNDLTQRGNFDHQGTVIKDNPGFPAGVWYLSYEVPGSPGLSIALDLNSVKAPYISLEQGERVRVVGTLYESVVRVDSITPVSAETDMPIKLYFYNPALDQGPGGAQCSKNGLVAVSRVIPETKTPLTDAVNLLLRGGISDEERASGITSEFPLPGLTLKSATITNKVATLTFDDPQNKTSGGSCRVAVLWAQIEATAKQFPTVQSVRFIPEELFQP